MSYTEIYAFNKEGNAYLYGEVHNAWRGAMAVWTTIEKRYLPQYIAHGVKTTRMLSGVTGDNSPANEIWRLADSLKLPVDERIVLNTTFDHCLVKREHIRHVIDAFRRFEGDTSLPLQAELLEEIAKNPEIIGVGWNQTSVVVEGWGNSGGHNEEGEPIPYNCLTGTDHYWLFDELICDANVEKWWAELADVPFDDVGPEEDMILAEDWRHFEKGDRREDIWHWFDEHHSKGVAFLMYGKKGSHD